MGVRTDEHEPCGCHIPHWASRPVWSGIPFLLLAAGCLTHQLSASLDDALSLADLTKAVCTPQTMAADLRVPTYASLTTP